VTYTAMGNLHEAESFYELALSHDPKNPNLLNVIANFYAEHTSKFNRATVLIDSALQLIPAENKVLPCVFLDTKGWIEYCQGNYAGAYSIFSTGLDKLLALYQPSPMINEKERETMLMASPNYAASPEVIRIRYHLALAAWHLGNKEQSRDLIGQILAVTPEFPTAIEWQQKARAWLDSNK
jgi:tetratricopeptide (TPR) repeat protein